MAKRNKKKRQQPRQQRQIKHSLHEALMCLRQKNLNAALHQALEVMHNAKEVTEIRKAEEILTEIHFRNAMHSQSPVEKLAHLKKALTHSPHEGRFHFQRGIALLQIGDAAEAVNAFDLAAKTEPEREGLEYFRQLARLADKQAIKKNSKLSQAEQNTLNLIALFQKPPLKKMPDNVPDGELIGTAPIWHELLYMRHDRKYVPPDSKLHYDFPTSNPQFWLLNIILYRINQVDTMVA